MVQATETWMSTPHQTERVTIARVPSTMPAKIAPTTSATGLWKWIMQYGTIITKMAYDPSARLSGKSMNPRKNTSSAKKVDAYMSSQATKSVQLRAASL